MLLPFTQSLMRTTKFDAECAQMADRHYSRRKHGSNQFMPPGETLVLRNAEGTVVFAWHRALVPRADRQSGICCSIFRNESKRQASSIILEAEACAVSKWGCIRAFTYVDSKKVKSPNPGYCFKAAGWQFVKKTTSGLHLLTKELY